MKAAHLPCLSRLLVRRGDVHPNVTSRPAVNLVPGMPLGTHRERGIQKGTCTNVQSGLETTERANRIVLEHLGCHHSAGCRRAIRVLEFELGRQGRSVDV